jgi:HK97 family phage portal protein
MGILDFFTKRATKIDPKQPRDPVVAQWLGEPLSASGINVDADKALMETTVFACVRVLSETIGQLPLILYRGQGEGKERASSHYLYDVLHNKPNNFQTSVEFREMMQAHLCLRGNAYATIITDGVRAVSQLLPLHPDRMRVHFNKDGRGIPTRIYEYFEPDGSSKVYLQDEIFHIMGMSLDGITGVSPIRYQRETIGYRLATNEYGSRFFSNNATPKGVLRHPDAMSDEAFDRLKASWNAAHKGLSNSHNIAILEEGVEFQPLSINAEDAQWIDSQKLSRSEISAIFRVPAHMINDLEKATFSNIENQGQEFVTYTMQPWAKKWEQAIARDLISQRGRTRDGLFAEFLFDALLRGDSEGRSKLYHSLFHVGAMSQNEIRAKENLNPIEGGDRHFVPLNMTSSTEEITGAEMSSDPAPEAIQK